MGSNVVYKCDDIMLKTGIRKHWTDYKC